MEGRTGNPGMPCREEESSRSEENQELEATEQKAGV